MKRFFTGLLLAWMFAGATYAQTFSTNAKISGGNPLINANQNDIFGATTIIWGDYNGDGIDEIVTSIPRSDINGQDQGGLLILYLNENYELTNSARINATEGGFEGPLNNFDLFGTALANAGDLDGNGVNDILVGSPGNDASRGAVWILFMASDGSVIEERKISSGLNGFDFTLAEGDNFGSGIGTLGHSNGYTTLLVGAPGDNNVGALWVIELNPNEVVSSATKITNSDFNGNLIEDGRFGSTIFISNNNRAIAGAPTANQIWILDFNDEYSLTSYETITGPEKDTFGAAIEHGGDLDGNGKDDLLVGSPQNGKMGTIWAILEGEMSREIIPLSELDPDFTIQVDRFDGFGVSLLSYDGQLIVGAPGDDDGGVDTGALWFLGIEAANQPPVANAGEDQIITLPDSVIIDGSNSFDPDGDPLTYSWVGPDGIELSGPVHTLKLEAGVYTFVLTVTDDQGATDTDEVVITVEGRNNQAPVANAGEDQIINCSGKVTLNGSNSTDPDGDILTYFWEGPSDLGLGILEGPVQHLELPSGEYVFTLKVDDGNGGTDSDEVRIKVSEASDPILKVSDKKKVLWPANHKMHTIKLSSIVKKVFDPCDSSLSIKDVRIHRVSSDEPANGEGDGNTDVDIRINENCTSVQLRAERQGGGNGRVYTLELSLTGSNGQEIISEYHVVVPHDKGKENKVIKDETVYSVEGCGSSDEDDEGDDDDDDDEGDDDDDDDGDDDDDDEEGDDDDDEEGDDDDDDEGDDDDDDERDDDDDDEGDDDDDDEGDDDDDDEGDDDDDDEGDDDDDDEGDDDDDEDWGKDIFPGGGFDQDPRDRGDVADEKHSPIRKLINFPDPFVTRTQIRFYLKREAPVSIDIFDFRGQKVASLFRGRLSEGKHQFVFDGSRLNSGIYIYHVRVGEHLHIGKMYKLR